MICSKCNTINANGMRFCGSCGAPLGLQQPQMQMQSGMQQPQQMQGGMQPPQMQQMQSGLQPPQQQPPQMQPQQQPPQMQPQQQSPQLQPGYGQQAQQQPQMQGGVQQPPPQQQPGYGQPPGQPAPTAGGSGAGGGKGLKAALIAVCILLAVAVTALVLVLTGVIGRNGSGGGRTDTAQSNAGASRSPRGGSDSAKTTASDSQQEEESEEETTDEALLVNQTASDIRTGSAWMEPHRLVVFVPERGSDYVSVSYDELRLMNSTDNPGTRSFMEGYADEESGYGASLEALFLQEEENLRAGTVTGSAIIWDETALYRNDSRVLSFVTHHNTPFDAASGRVGLWENTLETYNIDAQTGEALALSDVVTDIPRLSELASDALLEKCGALAESEPHIDNAAALVADEEALREAVRQLLAGEYMNADAFYAWSPAYLGLRMVFVTETVGIAYPSGYWTPPTIEIILPYSSAQDIFAAKWTELPESFIAELQFDTEYRFDFGAGARSFRISREPETEKGIPCAVRIGEREEQEIAPPGDSFYEAIGLPSGYLVPVPGAAYLVRQNGSHYFWVQYEIISAIGDYYCLVVYAAEDDTLREAGVLHEGITRLTPVVCPELFYVGHEFNPFFGDVGYFGMESCHVGEDGLPVRSGLGYSFYGTGATYKTLVPLNLRLADGFEPMTVPAGTLFTMSGTDGKTWMSFDTEYGIFYLDLEEYGRLTDLDGYSAEEAFEYVSAY